MTTPAAKTNDTRGTLYLAFELGWNVWKLAFTIGRAQKPRLRRVTAGDTAALQKEIALAKERFKLPGEARVVSCYEAGRDGFWLHRFLTSVGVENLVVDSASIEVSRRHRRPKTDRLDATKLVSMLVRWDEGEKVWSVAQVPSPEAEDARHLHRELATLKVERTRSVNRIRSLLAMQGVRVKTIGANFRQWLAKVRLWDGKPLPKGLGQRILMELDRLEYIRAQIAAIDRERRRLLREGQGKEAAVARKLLQLKAIGESTGWTYATELFGWRHFRNRKQVGSLVGLTPTPFASGDSSREQGIDKAGNRRVRAVAVEVAWGWVRHQPHSELTRWFQERFGEGSSRQRRIGIVALARRLLIDLWRYVEHGVVPQGAELKKA